MTDPELVEAIKEHMIACGWIVGSGRPMEDFVYHVGHEGTDVVYSADTVQGAWLKAIKACIEVASGA